MKAPSPTYAQAPRHLLAVDCLIFGVEGNVLKLLVFKREIAPLAGQWSLLGSFVQDQESVESAAARVLEEITGIRDLYMEQLHAFGQPNRDSGGRVVSIAYWSLIGIDASRQTFEVDGHEAKWVPADAVPELVLDHGDMVAMAITRLRERARFYPIGFELLPPEFTLLQLLQVYEAIYGHPLDERNFRKKILKSGLIEATDRKDMSTSRKGSVLYHINHERYLQLQAQGYDFAF